MQESLSKNQIIQKIKEKKEFSKIPDKDIIKVLEKTQKSTEEETIKETRKLLRSIYTAFIPNKLFTKKEKSPEYILNKHISTKERLPFYSRLYSHLENERTIIDLGAGVNALSYPFLKNTPVYISIEAEGHMVEIVSKFFKENKINGKSYHVSLFNLKEIKEIIKKQKSPKTLFIFKTLDSLEMLERNYSKNLLKEIIPLADRTFISFSTSSLSKKSKFKTDRKWLTYFLKENFLIKEEFQLGNEKYIIIQNKH